MNILLTGASGFIGKHFLQLIDQSMYKVYALTRNPEKLKGILPDEQVIKGDLQCAEEMNKALSGIAIVVHAAAEIRNYDNIEKTNVKGTENLISAMKLNHVKRIIHLSSVGVVGMQFSFSPVLVDEKHECSPKNKYEETKYAAEQLLRKKSKEEQFNLSIIRPTNVFGEAHPRNALLKLAGHIKKGYPIFTVRGAYYNYVYVKDVVALMINLTAQHHHTGVVNIGEAVSVSEICKLIATELGVKSKVYFLPSWLWKCMVKCGVKLFVSFINKVKYSDAKLKHSFTYSYGVKTGIRQTLTYFQNKGVL